MFTSKYYNNLVNPSLESYRLLYDCEKKDIENTYRIYTISVNNLNCISLGAKVGDIICKKNHITKIYRKVV
jgi:hypothetical protein